ncbi:hypothetical protein [Myxococcus llanfairpwllgwyngyllgogerychwyrndrobwllllantysiliogogogochensis]|uniref:hypothetical protein n=1 Tax=Myxococcus llanfairpwllgwyngyllgogerychwyrndrobwllllantysiliogogogochensis TaxID=2590453 RepID=UPI001C671F5D|nr:hypothetical protein [Myxococcus llanfairpwllgwyngyllgogerychwyrndrobwllllantysiliogogogochensis]
MALTRTVRWVSTLWSAGARGVAAQGALLACALLFAQTAGAQTTEDRAYVGVTFARGTEIGSQGGRLDERKQLELRLPLPPVFLGRTVLVPSFGYETRFMGLEQHGPLADVAEEKLGRQFHRFQLGLTLIRPLTPRWMLVTGAVANTRTDFKSSFDFGLDTSWAGFAMANYLIGGDPDVRLTFGLVALYPFDATPVVPMIAFAYRKGPYILEVGLPRLAMLYKVGDGLELGITGMFDQQVFRSRIPYDEQGPRPHYIRETALRFGPTVNARLGNGNLWVSSSIGLDFLNDYALLDKDRDRVELGLLQSTGPAPYLRVSLGWRPPRRPREAIRPVGGPPERAAPQGNSPTLIR